MDGLTQSSETTDPAGGNYVQGRTVISDTAVAKVVGVAARGVPGVHALGTGASRSIGAIRDVVGATDLTQGIRVEVGESQVAVDIVFMAEYGYPLQELANTVRAAVYDAVEGMVGRSVIEVNIEITDVYVPAPDAEKQQPRPRLTERLGVKSAPSPDLEDQS
ncbi:Asp23/Gls24 family envelope stress response protein [Arthrobacter sp. GMC3]|uniref:Asp23/Gls24 family envelope stress response protein n=1 Tax=Arthrobacter sp. GMC3 TaxID=2058894 RepID=UPI000CE3AA4D|nr:Asp23/Gls24 family envelope stress response protein [Arthrobacter sp. GMC3]